MLNKPIVMFFRYLKVLIYLAGSLACFYFCYEMILMLFGDIEIRKATANELTLVDGLEQGLYFAFTAALSTLGASLCKSSFITGYVANNHLNREDLTDKQSKSLEAFENKLDYAQTLIGYLVLVTVILFAIYIGIKELIITDSLKTLSFILGAGLIPLILYYTAEKFLYHFNTDNSLANVIIKTIIYTNIGWTLFWPVIIEMWSNGQSDDWSGLVGMIYVGSPLGLILFVLFRVEKDGRANQIAWDLATDAQNFMEEELKKSPGMINQIEDILPIENDRLKIIDTKKGVSWYAKEFDAWFIRDTVIYHCDDEQNILYHVKRPAPIGDLKKSFIRDNDTRWLGKSQRQKL